MGYKSHPELWGRDSALHRVSPKTSSCLCFAEAVPRLRWASLPSKFSPSLTMQLQSPAPGSVLGCVGPAQTWQTAILLSSSTFHEAYLVSFFFFNKLCSLWDLSSQIRN